MPYIQKRFTIGLYAGKSIWCGKICSYVCMFPVSSLLWSVHFLCDSLLCFLLGVKGPCRFVHLQSRGPSVVWVPRRVNGCRRCCFVKRVCAGLITWVWGCGASSAYTNTHYKQLCDDTPNTWSNAHGLGMWIIVPIRSINDSFRSFLAFFIYPELYIRKSFIARYDYQCWGKLLLKVMHYNIALLPKKVTNFVT